VKPDVIRVSGGFRIALLATPRAAKIRASFDDSDPRTAQEAPHGEFDAPPGATRLRVIAEVDGQFSEEETASLSTGVKDKDYLAPSPPKAELQPDAPARMTSRFEPKDTAAAFAALDRLSKIPGVKIHGGMVEANGGRSEQDFLTVRLGRDVPIHAPALNEMVKVLAQLLGAEAPTVNLRLDGIAFPSGRDLMAFCDAAGDDFDRVTWQQD
jgi:hypothetical protein